MPENTRITPRIKNLMELPTSALTGRPKTFLLHPERKTNAPSCQMHVYKNDLGDTCRKVAEYLKFGAGVKVQLENFVDREPINTDWFFLLEKDHPDFEKISVNALSKTLNKTTQDVEDLVKSTDDLRFIKVEDNMRSIEESWIDFIETFQQGKIPVLDLNAIRPAGINSITGVVSTGLFGIDDEDEGFVSVYFWIADHLRDGKIGSLLRLLGGLCKVIARGGTHKNGIVTTATRYDALHAEEYLDFPLEEIIGSSKKGIRFDSGVLASLELSKKIIEKVNEESLFLEKIDPKDPELYHNVCVGLKIKDKASCLTSPVNAGQLRSPEDIPNALCAMTELLCLIHESWRKENNADPDLYLPLEQDNQIGVTWLGWANFLRQQGVSYADHVWGLKTFRGYLFGDEDYRNGKEPDFLNNLHSWDATHARNHSIQRQIAVKIAAYLWEGYHKAAKVPESLGMNLSRIFGIEPNQRCYGDYADLDGFTTCRNIDPPFAQYQQRNSEVYGDKLFYHGAVETVAEIGHALHQEHWEEWQLIMNSTGKAHAMSFDWYEPLTLEKFTDFVQYSPLTSSYYMQAQKVDQSYLNKGQALIAGDNEDEEDEEEIKIASCNENFCIACGN